MDFEEDHEDVPPSGTPAMHNLTYEEAKKITDKLVGRYLSGQCLLEPPIETPNLAALDDELEKRIRRLVHAELAPLVEAEVERKLQLRFPWLKEPDMSPPAASSLASNIVQNLPEWAQPQKEGEQLGR